MRRVEERDEAEAHAAAEGRRAPVGEVRDAALERGVREPLRTRSTTLLLVAEVAEPRLVVRAVPLASAAAPVGGWW